MRFRDRSCQRPRRDGDIYHDTANRLLCASADGGRILGAMKPRIAITVGDPAGIGPEIARKAAKDPRVRELCEPVVYGPPAGTRFTVGELSAEAGRAAYETLSALSRMRKRELWPAVATAPVNKLAFARAGLPWKGHTELLAHLTGSHGSR